MPLELIRRRDGDRSTKQTIRHQHTQFSLNSYGHACIREFDDEQAGYECELGDAWNCDNEEAIKTRSCSGLSCPHYKHVMLRGEEHLLSMDRATTEGFIKFIFENRSTYELRELLKGIVKHELPF